MANVGKEQYLSYFTMITDSQGWQKCGLLRVKGKLEGRTMKRLERALLAMSCLKGFFFFNKIWEEQVIPSYQLWWYSFCGVISLTLTP